MRKPGDIEMVFAHAMESRVPVRQAKLIKKVKDWEGLEEWSVEFIDDEGSIYKVMLKSEKQNDN